MDLLLLSSRKSNPSSWRLLLNFEFVAKHHTSNGTYQRFFIKAISFTLMSLLEKVAEGVIEPSFSTRESFFDGDTGADLDD